MPYLYAKNPNLGIFLSALEWKIWVYLQSFWYMASPFVYVTTICGQLVHFSHFGMTYQETIGNPASQFTGSNPLMFDTQEESPCKVH
jgi:hypothetical protein